MKIGIIGSGQLGKMLIESSQGMGDRSYNKSKDLSYNHNSNYYNVLSPTIECPCKNLANKIIVGSLYDSDKLEKLCQESDIITYEIEHTNTDCLINLEKSNKKIIPSPKILQIIQNKCSQKQFFKNNNIPTAPFLISNATATAATTELPEEMQIYEKFVLKSGYGGYDGKGVQIISVKEWESSQNNYDSTFVCEAFIYCKKELSVIVAVGKDKIVTYPSVEMVFKNDANMLDYMFCPANISEDLEESAQQLAIKTIKSFAKIYNDIRGIYAVELFLDYNDKLFVNEIAPRPHNSGHHTIEAFTTSQYQQLNRILTDQPLGEISMLKCSGMINLIGPDDFVGKYKLNNLDKLTELPDVYIHDYGKIDSRPNRKLGHITILADNTDNVLEKIEQIKKIIKIEKE